eukprot:CAMPEP_0176503408 /NCGR_PEP_ID=MMETSP0200_2-20121128/15346_1 /TAXON_ID=947934 /ORGANISM="Chaetoceros sp., Strain GSL56" /LENGTH=1375 /DNA_ID=CAMNT_0017902695 /DNA_START=80 /DNA_END=4204 /DNA_ORIENTATION=+
MSRTASNTSLLSDGRYVPWQYKWRRPMISRAKSVEEKYDRCRNDICNKVPISMTSARLNAEELSLLLRHMNYFAKEDEREFHLDKSTSGSDSQEEPNIVPNDDVSYFVLVTTFAPKSIVSFLETMSKEDDDLKVIPAESILLEVIKDSLQSFDAEITELGWDRDEMDIIISELFYWPASIHDNSFFEGDNIQWHDENGDSSIWTFFLRGLKLRKVISEMTEEDKHHYDHQQKLIKLKEFNRRIGVTGISVSRIMQQISGQEFDVDEVYGLVDRLGLGVGIGLDSDVSASEIDDYRDSHYIGEGKLMLSCLCNDGRVHVFSLIDLILKRNIERKPEGENPTLGQGLSSIDSANKSFIDGFESFLFGESIKASLHENILPLTNPITTIELSINCSIGEKVSRNQQLVHHMEKSEELSNSPKNEGLREVIMKVEEQMDNYRPRIDLSSLDANIETSTLPDQTVHNIPFLCTSAFEYIVIGGNGYRKYALTSLERGRQSRRRRFKGGFVSFISTKYLSEARTVYLPFHPKIISPVLWNSVQFVIVLGQSTDQCVAIRVDSSSRLIHHDHPTDSSCSATNQQFLFLKKFCPIYISFYGLNETEPPSTFPISVSNISDAVPSIIICTMDNGDMNLQRFGLDVLIYAKQGRSRPKQEMRSTDVHIAARLNHRRFVSVSPSSFVEFQFDNGLGSNINLNRESIGCISNDGWILLSLKIGEKKHLFFASFDGSTGNEGAYYQEIAALDCPEDRLRNKILNADFLTPISVANSYCSSQKCLTRLNDANIVNGSETFNNQMAIATLKLSGDETIMVTMRKCAISNGASSSFDEIIKWLCSECDYVTAGRISLSLLNDSEGLVDLEHTVLLSHGDNTDEACSEGILDGISIRSYQGLMSPSGTRSRPLQSFTSAKSQADREKQRNMTQISNTAISCLVKGGPTLSHTLEKFLGRNEFYDASSACRTLVSSAAETVKKCDAADTNLTSYFLSRIDGNALWPIRCLLRVASSRNCLEHALEMLNESIPDILRNRVNFETKRNHPNFELSLKLSMSIISMILASADHAASYLLNLVDTVTNQLYWVSLDDETRRSLSILHVQGRLPLLREFEARAWTLDLLQKATRLKPCDNQIEIDSFVKSEWLRDICTGVLCNAGCDLSHTILFTPALSTEVVKEMDMNEKNMFRQIQEEEEDLYDYLEPAPRCGGIDFDLIIPAFLILEKRQVHWLGNEKVPSQTILNIVCDLAGRYSEEPNYSFDAVSAMKQCMEIGNPEAAANLIGGQNGLFLKCAYILSKEFNLTIQEAEHVLNGDLASIPGKRKVVEEQTQFVLTNSHKSLLLLLEKHVMVIRKYGDFHCGDSRGRLNPIHAARTCLKTWFLLTPLYPYSGPW